ncbi:MAG: phosphoribosylanthranilate isomerase [Phycisphaerae bacterium]|nr:phosphoribosylanthranilate isomerase [Phycisphaerae bacterium]
MKIKICGITTPDDARLVADAGADAIGLNFVAGPRRIDLAQAEGILDALPPLVVPVALVQLTDGLLNEQVAELLATRWIATIQIYGEVTPAAVTRLAWEGYRPIVPVHVRDETFAQTVPAVLATDRGRGAAAILLDTPHADKLGGTGQSFAWSWLRQARQRGELDAWPPVLLAGGLTPDNVAAAIETARPYGVDVASGVEDEPGRKSPEKVRRFIAEARRASKSE